MHRGPRWLLIGVIVLLGIGEVGWLVHQAMEQIAQAHLKFQQQMDVRQADQARAAKLLSVWQSPHPFSRDEANAFLDQAKLAEAIADPLQRCVAYPDPPGSHWSHAAVVAYCQYRYQPVITFAEVQQLIQNGRAAEVDRRFAELLQAQLTDPAAHGRLDHAFYEDFRNGSFDIRPTLDAWMRDSPKSAFAFAASGYAYKEMAFTARGNGYMSDTPQSNVDSMDRLLAQADSDLRQAIALDPRVTPAYSAMIEAGTLGLGRRYALDAARRGLAVAPDNYAIYLSLMWLDQPKWGGSLRAMIQLAAEAQTQADHNPLLLLLQPAPSDYEIANCGCAVAKQLAAYPSAFDQLPSNGYMAAAAAAAHGQNSSVELIYLSEALRFNAELDGERTERIYDLIDFDEAAWGVAEASSLLKRTPNDTAVLTARAQAYEAMSDFAHAEHDWRTLLALAPGDVYSLSRLGSMFVNWQHDWGKGWAVADQLIRQHPQDPYGWILRATIQEQQPRPGLADTADYFEAHFGQLPALRNEAARMRAAVIMQTHSGRPVMAARAKAAAAATH